MSFTIAGVGSGLPQLSVDNDRLSTLVDTSDAWIRSRTGIASRHICTTESLTDLAYQAAQQALQAAGLAPEQLDLIICSTISADHITPTLSCLVQQRLGASCRAVDINAACTGFVYGLEMADAYMKAGKAKNVLLVAGEVMSRHVDWQDRATCVLFGDGAGAVVLTPGEGLLAITTGAQGDDSLLRIPSHSGSCPFTQLEAKPQHLYMNGGEVYKFAINAICRDVAALLQESGLTLEDIDLLIPHQANRRIIDAARVKLGMPPEKVVCAIERYGNTSSASIPLVLAELWQAGKLQKGTTLLLTAFGGGLTTGACIIRL